MKNTLLIFLIGIASFSNAQRLDISRVDMNDLLAETQINAGGSDTLELHLWLPLEFWKVSMSQDPSIDKGQVNDFLKVLEPYTMVAVVDGRFGLFGSIVYEELDTIRDNYRMMDKDGKLYAPLKEESLNDEVQLLLGMFKPMMSSMLGQMGQNLQFFVFNNQDENGDRIFSPYVENSTRVQYKGKVRKWKTPFGALLKKKKCPVDEELHNGAWEYCPYHGEKLKRV